MFVHYTLEPNSHNTDGCCVVLYWAPGIKAKPSDEDIRRACRDGRGKFNVSCDVEDQFFSFEERPTPVSDRADLLRYECHPTG